MHEAWNWIDGTPLDYVDWDKGQPNKSLGCDCGCIELQRGTWMSKNCDDPKPFVCRMSMSLEPVTTPKPKNQCPETWTYHSSTEACYKVYTQDTNWTYAENFCFLKAGAHLVSIHSLEENAFVTNLIPFDPNNHKCNTFALAWIGLFSVTQQETWQWTDNSPFNYSLWAPGKPPGLLVLLS
uniref:C-type lectin domain-containing protein n=1 Tax=Panagrolaimus davidi TaxID=227884 RepID=A0A914PZG0_9BILA